VSRITLFLMILSLGVASGANAADAHPLFQSDEVLKAVLTAPIAQTYEQRNQDIRLYFPGQWTYIGDDGETARLVVSIRTRGNFRRQYCEFPPLQLNFKKSQVKTTLFAGQDKLKVVAPCKRVARFQQYVILEYLAYRTLEILTDYSFKTRLLRLTYVDSEEKIEPWTDIVFVIEDDSDVAKRLGLDRLKIEQVGFAELDREKTALAELFQFTCPGWLTRVMRRRRVICRFGTSASRTTRVYAIRRVFWMGRSHTRCRNARKSPHYLRVRKSWIRRSGSKLWNWLGRSLTS